MSGGSRRAWGWHPLADDWAVRVVADAQVKPGELVLDLGAGRGALTAALVAAGARVVAVELHPGRVRYLTARFAGAPVRVVHADALSMPLPGRPYRVVANPPYAISSPLLRRLLARGSRLYAADLVLPRVVVRRWSERGVARWDLHGGRLLPRRAFRPPPGLDSSVLVVRRR